MRTPNATASGLDPADTTLTAQRWVELARSLAPLVESEVPQSAEDKIITGTVIQAWKDAGLYGVLLPKHLGGAGIDDMTYLQIAEEISRQDASAGWVYANHQTGTLHMGMLLPEDAFRELLGPDALGVACGSGDPLGSHGTAIPVEGGYIVEDPPRYFGSGSQRANRVASRVALCDEHGQTRIGDDGKPLVVPIWVDPENVEWAHDWDPSGLLGTGSGTYRVKKHFLETKWMAVEQVPGFPDDPALAQGFQPVSTLHHVGVGLGLAKRILEELVKCTRGRRRGVVAAVDSHPLFQSEFVRIESQYQAARAFVFDSYQKLWDATAEHRLTELHVARVEQSSVFLYRTLDDIISTASLWAGSDVIPKNGTFALLNANARVAVNHLRVSPLWGLQLAPHVLEVWQGEH